MESSRVSPPPYSFSHTPPRTVTGICCWPGTSNDQQGSNNRPRFVNIWSKMSLAYLTATDVCNCKLLLSQFRYGQSFTTVSLTRPWNSTRFRLWGFGNPSKSRSTTSKEATFPFIFHMVWTYLQPAERHRCSSASPPLGYYVNLRFCANCTSIAHIQVQQRSPTVLPSLCSRIATSFACALLRFDFIFGDFQIWISSE